MNGLKPFARTLRIGKWRNLYVSYGCFDLDISTLGVDRASFNQDTLRFRCLCVVTRIINTLVINLPQNIFYGFKNIRIATTQTLPVRGMVIRNSPFCLEPVANYSWKAITVNLFKSVITLLKTRIWTKPRPHLVLTRALALDTLSGDFSYSFYYHHW